MLLLFISVFGLFLFTLHPSITAGDSGEISAAVFSMGIPHPSGYPLYVIIAKLLTLALPFGNIAYRVNMLSAIFGALSCAMVYMITIKIVGAGLLATAKEGQPQGLSLRLTPYVSRLASIFASLSFAISYELWYRSTIAEVYTLNTFLMLLIVYVLLTWREETAGTAHPTRSTSRLLYLASFLLGLGIGNHHTIVLVIPGAIVFVLWTVGAISGWRPICRQETAPTFSLLIAFFVLGLSVYLYLPIRSSQNPFMDWGNPQILNNFLDVFTRKTYLPEDMGRDWGLFASQLKSFNPSREFTILGLLFGLIGIRWVWKRDKRAAVMFLATSILISYGLIVLAGSSTGDMGTLRKFYLPAYAVFSVFMGVGAATLLKHRLTSHLSRFTVVLAAVSLIWQFSVHYSGTRNSNNYLAYDYGMNELNSLRESSAYISKGEVKTFPLWYLQGVERYREDVEVITAYFLTQRWYLKEVLRIVGVPREIPQDLTYEQVLIHSIYMGNAGKGVYAGFLDEEYIPRNLLNYTQGITFQLYKKPEERLEGDVWSMYRLRGVERVDEWMDRGIVEILKDYASSHYNTGLEYYDKGDRERAVTEFEKAVEINPGEPDSLNNLAVLYAENGIKLKEAEIMAKKAFELYTGEKDREMARETIEEIEKKMKDSI